jgi:hypothetical protein
MTTAVSQHNPATRRSPSLSSAAGVGVFAIVVVAGLALQHHTPGQVSPAVSDPPVVSYPGSAVFDNQPASSDPPVVSYPGSAVFDNQPAAPWWRHHNALKGPGGSQ